MNDKNIAYRAVLFVICIVAIVSPAKAFAQQITVDPPFIDGKCHLIDTIWIELDQNIFGVEAASFKISFDQDLAHFVDSLDTVVVPTALDGNVFLDYEIFASDSMRIDIGILQTDFSGPGQFVGIVIELASQLNSTFLSVDRSILRNSANENLAHTVMNGCSIAVLCCCEFHGDVYVDIYDVLDANDLNRLIDYLFFGAPPPAQDAGCPHLNRGEVSCDGIPDAVDLNTLIEHLFFGGSICDPCDCDAYPLVCP